LTKGRAKLLSVRLIRVGVSSYKETRITRLYWQEKQCDVVLICFDRDRKCISRADSQPEREKMRSGIDIRSQP